MFFRIYELDNGDRASLHDRTLVVEKGGRRIVFEVESREDVVAAISSVTVQYELEGRSDLAAIVALESFKVTPDLPSVIGVVVAHL